MNNTEKKFDSAKARRNFLKKAVYTVPAVIVLGTLSAPVTAHASIIHNQTTVYFDNPDNTALVTEDYDNVGNFTQEGTFTPTDGTTTVYNRETIVSAENNWIQNIFDAIFRPTT